MKSRTALEIMEEKVYGEYRIWLKKKFDIYPEDTYCNCNMLLELKSMRDESIGVFGDTEFVKMLKESGNFEQNKKKWEKYKILTFEEYKEYYKKVLVKTRLFRLEKPI